MPDTPVRIGPARTADVLWSAVLLPVLGAIPALAYLVTVAIVFACVDGGKGVEVVALLGVLVGVAVSLGVPLSVAFRTRRAGYRVLPVVAAVSPFLVPGWAVAGFPGA
ncbi:hypothetical protein AB0D10_12470 [Kitasatospora sp. NPDC048545]|uniref:hypothetical protein n=1 Tax=Kitasatospora sp. NPDC048545 TaxID=3157208 RepID=UPI0033E18243